MMLFIAWTIIILLILYLLICLFQYFSDNEDAAVAIFLAGFILCIGWAIGYLIKYYFF